MFCAKIDIKKAFDSVSREFLLARMLQKGFPKPFINWIKACISNVNFSVIIEGALEGFFSSSTGLRQGCPLSPFLFCLVMDAFSNLLDERGFKDATLDNCRILSATLKEFANVSGLHINYDKCSVMFSKKTRNRDLLCQALSICNVSYKLVYLGIPISFTRLKVEDFLPSMDQIHKKFTGWKANLLSFAGRLQYLKFTIQNTIAYWIGGSILPKTVFKFFRKTCSKFLFFGDIKNCTWSLEILFFCLNRKGVWVSL
ncbi:5'-3' exoribonuclease 2 [Dendrobium catenatum]|uniref:5'-3' exoribonuclease 2 n=1 Tax=Dendrobium catenatum TaxID=906689 RepID=A0A2I0XGL7_9ASPA|nr:5'-3' exoribonuclease 2 [Dendrobium catenatum]